MLTHTSLGTTKLRSTSAKLTLPSGKYFFGSDDDLELVDGTASAVPSAAWMRIEKGYFLKSLAKQKGFTDFLSILLLHSLLLPEGVRLDQFPLRLAWQR